MKAELDELSEKWTDMCRRAKIIVSFVSDGHDAWADNMRELAGDARCYFVQPRPADHWNHPILQPAQV